MSLLKNSAKKIANFVYKHFETSGSGTMILLTSLTGIALSAFAQTGAIIINKKYTTSQKAFMIPQELTEGFITIIATLIVVTPLQNLAKKCVSKGKIRSKAMTNYMKENNLFKLKNEKDFDFLSSVNYITTNLKKSDYFTKSTTTQQKNLLQKHENIIQDYNSIFDGTSAIATTTGSVLSTAFISPFLRNYTASYLQQFNIDTYNKIKQTQKNNYKTNTFKSNYYNPCRI